MMRENEQKLKQAILDYIKHYPEPEIATGHILALIKGQIEIVKSELLGKLLLQKMHSITHGDITHPHETEEDRIYNVCLSQVKQLIETEFK